MQHGAEHRVLYDVFSLLHAGEHGLVNTGNEAEIFTGDFNGICPAEGLRGTIALDPTMDVAHELFCSENSE